MRYGAMTNKTYRYVVKLAQEAGYTPETNPWLKAKGYTPETNPWWDVEQHNRRILNEGGNKADMMFPKGFREHYNTPDGRRYVAARANVNGTNIRNRVNNDTVAIHDYNFSRNSRRDTPWMKKPIERLANEVHFAYGSPQFSGAPYRNLIDDLGHTVNRMYEKDPSLIHKGIGLGGYAKAYGKHNLQWLNTHPLLGTMYKLHPQLLWMSAIGEGQKVYNSYKGQPGGLKAGIQAAALSGLGSALFRRTPLSLKKGPIAQGTLGLASIGYGSAMDDVNRLTDMMYDKAKAQDTIENSPNKAWHENTMHSLNTNLFDDKRDRFNASHPYVNVNGHNISPAWYALPDSGDDE